MYNLEQEKARTTVIIRSGKSSEQRETPFISPPPFTLFLLNLNFSFFFSSKTEYCTYIRWVLIRVWLFVTSCTVACQAPLSMGFPRQEYWGGVAISFSGTFLTQRSNPCLLHWQVNSLLSHQESQLWSVYLLNISLEGPASYKSAWRWIWSWSSLCIWQELTAFTSLAGRSSWVTARRCVIVRFSEV